MPSPKVTDDDATPTRPNPKNPTTPRRASAVKRTPNGTPDRKTSTTKAATPNSAPVRTKTGAKKPEPTLFTDFLLGRPSPSRTRRKSLDVVKAEMKQEMVSKVQPPGGVKDRVKQWQKASAAAVIEDPGAASEPEEILVQVEEESVDEDDRIRIKMGQQKFEGPGRRKSKDEEVKVRSKSAPRKRVISDDHWMKKKIPPRKRENSGGAAIPKDFLQTTAANPPLSSKIEDWARRVDSDEIVVEEEPENKKPRRKKSKYAVPDDGIRVFSSGGNSVNDGDDGIRIKPLRETSVDGIRVKPSRKKSIDDGIRVKTSKDMLNDDGIRVKPSRKKSIDDGIRVKPSKDMLNDDGIRVKPSKDMLNDDGIRVKPSTDILNDDGIRIKPSKDMLNDGVRVKHFQDSNFDDDSHSTSSRKEKSKRTPKESDVDGHRTHRKPSRYLKPSPDLESSHRGSASDGGSQITEDEQTSWNTPTRSQRSKRNPRKSDSPAETLADIPFGNSAFSVLDMPLGAEAGTMKRPKPQRAPSLSAVPKVFRKVYNEGKKIVHDTVEPPRPSLNQPPSIESWLNGTTDPFVDRPEIPKSSSTLEVQESSSRRRSYKEDDPSERDLTVDVEGERLNSGNRRKHRVRGFPEHEASEKLKEEIDSPSKPARPSESVSIDVPKTSSPTSPSGLRRSPATRTTSSPIKSVRRQPFKDAFMDAFKGESIIDRPKSSPGPLIDEFDQWDRQKERVCKDSVDAARHTSKSSPDPPMPPAHRAPKTPYLDELDRQRGKPFPATGRRVPPTTGEHRLSTIASIETFSTVSSARETATELSQTTATQATTNSGGEVLDLSRRCSSKSGLRRRLTKHSDLISMLSLPDSAAPGKGRSIRSARSVRTSRSHLETATMRDLIRELAEDESKYMRELKTLVDGVIPVLLTCVLSKSESAIAAGLFNPESSDMTDASFTKPIVAMGVALERLKSLHRRIPLEGVDAIITWAQSAHRVYEDYVAAWRMGFQDVVVNLAPASRTTSAEEQSVLDGLPRNAAGDVINTNGERVDVAFLLKRPLVRVKYLAKLTKGLNKLRPSGKAETTMALYDDLHSKIRRRQKEEAARLEDQAANNTDPTRARDPRTLAQVEDAQIDRTRQVCAKDFFALDLSHSSGQRIECQVELLLRDKPSDHIDPGDLLICKVDTVSRFLLFPPISRDLASARIGDNGGHVVVMIRGFHDAQEWRELFILETDDHETAIEWVQMLGEIPLPPPIVLKDLEPSSERLLPLPLPAPPTAIDDKITPSDSVEIPIGQRRRGEAETRALPVLTESKAIAGSLRPVSSLPKSIKELSPKEAKPSVCADAGVNTDSLPVKHQRAARYHARTGSASTISRAQSPGSQSLPDSKAPAQPQDDLIKDNSHEKTPVINPIASPTTTTELPFIPKVRHQVTPPTTESPQRSSPLKESMRPEPDSLKKRQPVTPVFEPTTVRNDGAPPPPAHKTLTPNTLKTPILESPTPRTLNRRSSSPLKHEYQPSEASGTSSEASDSEDDDSSFSGSSDDEDEELEAADLPEALPGVRILGERISPSGSLYSLPNTSLAPSQSASQAPYRGVPVQSDPTRSKKVVAMISSWSNKKGRWEDLYPDPCSVVVTAGLIEAFEISASHSSPTRGEPIFESSGSSDVNTDADAGAERPLVALVLTPLVSLRQSTALDIEIQSPPTARSKLKCSGTVRYRALTVIACQELYQAIHRARLDNPVYKKLEQERMVNSYGGQSYEAAVASNRRRSWFGRQRSYRASTRAPSATISDGSNNSLSSSAFSALKRLSGGSVFNIARSSVDTAQNHSANVAGLASFYTSSSDSATSGLTPPRTPTSPSLSGTTTSNVVSLGSENLKIRLYCLETSSKWNDIGAARLSVTQPPPGMRQASSLYNGMEKRIIVTRKPAENDKMQDEPVVLLDVVLGSGCFSKVGRTGIAVNVWEDVTGPNGELGMVGAVGGVSGRTRKWMLQCGSAADANWIFGLVAVGR